MTLQEAANWAQILGVPLGLIALWLAYRQLKGVRAEVHKAVDVLSRRVHWRSVSKFPSQMHQVQEELDQAMRDENPAGASAAFRSWARMARDVAGTLDVLEDDSAVAMRLMLEESAVKCETAKNSVFSQGVTCRAAVDAHKAVGKSTGTFAQRMATEQAKLLTEG